MIRILDDLPQKWSVYVVIAYVGIAAALFGLYQVNSDAKALAEANRVRGMRACEKLNAIAEVIDTMSGGRALKLRLEKIDEMFPTVKPCVIVITKP